MAGGRATGAYFSTAAVRFWMAPFFPADGGGEWAVLLGVELHTGNHTRRAACPYRLTCCVNTQKQAADVADLDPAEKLQNFSIFDPLITPQISCCGGSGDC